MRPASTGSSTFPPPASQSMSNQRAYGDSGPSRSTSHSGQVVPGGGGHVVGHDVHDQPEAVGACRARPAAAAPPRRRARPAPCRGRRRRSRARSRARPPGRATGADARRRARRGTARRPRRRRTGSPVGAAAGTWRWASWTRTYPADAALSHLSPPPGTGRARPPGRSVTPTAYAGRLSTVRLPPDQRHPLARRHLGPRPRRHPVRDRPCPRRPATACRGSSGRRTPGSRRPR